MVVLRGGRCGSGHRETAARQQRMATMTYRVKKEKGGGYKVFAADDHKALKTDGPKPGLKNGPEEAARNHDFSKRIPSAPAPVLAPRKDVTITVDDVNSSRHDVIHEGTPRSRVLLPSQSSEEDGGSSCSPWHSARSLCSNLEEEGHGVGDGDGDGDAVRDAASDVGVRCSPARQVLDSSSSDLYHSARSVVCATPEKHSGPKTGGSATSLRDGGWRNSGFSPEKDWEGQTVECGSPAERDCVLKDDAEHYLSPSKNCGTTPVKSRLLSAPSPKHLLRSVRSLCSTPVKKAPKERRHSTDLLPPGLQKASSALGLVSRMLSSSQEKRKKAPLESKKKKKKQYSNNNNSNPRQYLSPQRDRRVAELLQHSRPYSASDRDLWVREERRCRISSSLSPGGDSLYASLNLSSNLYASPEQGSWVPCKNASCLHLYIPTPATPKKDRFLYPNHRPYYDDHLYPPSPLRRKEGRPHSVPHLTDRRHPPHLPPHPPQSPHHVLLQHRLRERPRSLPRECLRTPLTLDKNPPRPGPRRSRPSYMDYGWIYPDNPRRVLNYDMYDQRCWVRAAELRCVGGCVVVFFS
ncbi:hypothetical protein ACOMHN_051142 [Nucella lapillus]